MSLNSYQIQSRRLNPIIQSSGSAGSSCGGGEESGLINSFLAMVRPHILLITLPAQGHINPSLQFAKRLIFLGVEVTFATTLFGKRHMLMSSSSTTQSGLFNIAIFSDGQDDDRFKKQEEKGKVGYGSEFHKGATKTIKEVIKTSSDQGRPVSCLVYTLLLPWAIELARECKVHAALLWIQPAIVLDIYHYYFNGFEDEIKNHSTNQDWSIQFPGLPLVLKAGDLPSLLLPSCQDDLRIYLESLKQQVEKLDQEEKPRVLVNTFDALETDSLNAIKNYNMMGIGPLIPSVFLDGKDPLDTSYSFDLFKKSKDYMGWLNSLPVGSIVYVSFGSLLTHPKQQMEEIARGLLESGKPFLWVIREQENGDEKEKLSCIEELEQKGMIVPWCSQLEVLTHPSLACFVSHCGWNSTLESLSCGVPLVAFPHWSDQGTNAKMIQDIWRTGVRVKAKEDGFVESDEIKRCIKLVMDDEETGQELMHNAKKWKDLAREAVIQGGTSSTNLTKFIEEVGQPLYFSGTKNGD